MQRNQTTAANSERQVVSGNQKPLNLSKSKGLAWSLLKTPRGWSGSVKHLADRLCIFSGGPGGVSRASVSTLMSYTGQSRATIFRNLAKLKEEGVIVKVGEFESGVVQYRVLIPDRFRPPNVVPFPVETPPSHSETPIRKNLYKNLKTGTSMSDCTNGYRRGDATPKQLAYLRSLAPKVEEPVPVHLTHSRASELIDEWKAQIGPPLDAQQRRSANNLEAGRAWLKMKGVEDALDFSPAPPSAPVPPASPPAPPIQLPATSSSTRGSTVGDCSGHGGFESEGNTLPYNRRGPLRAKDLRARVSTDGLFCVPFEAMVIDLRPFQRQFIRGATAPGIDTACLSTPRGNGKSWLAGYLVSRILDPDDDLFVPGSESVLCAASIEQARIVFRFARQELEPRGGYRFLDSHTRIGINHVDSNTRLRVIGSNGKTAMGLVGCPWAICDEPGAWEVNGGTLLHDAIETAKGKPGSPLRAVYIGTLAPSTSGWWHDLVAAGSNGSTFVQVLQGDIEKWDKWPEIRRVNPLTSVSPEFRKKLLEERDKALSDSRLKARFLSFRMNRPSSDESTMLLTVEDWERCCGRPVPPRQGRPIVGVDLGGGRAWSAAVALWKNGRVEALAVAPGIPSIADQEKRDRVPAGLYRKLVEGGRLRIAEGLRVQPVAHLYDAVVDLWGRPVMILSDFFRFFELKDVVGSVPLYPRRRRWSEASEDIRAVRKIAADGPLSVEAESQNLIAASLAVSLVQNDDQGSVRLLKRSTNNTARDDVAAGLVLVAGAFIRSQRKRPRWRYMGMAG